MFYHREFEFSLVISIIFHFCLAVIFFFIVFHHRLPTFGAIEISIIKLPEKEESKIPIPQPKIKEKKIIVPVKKELKLKIKEIPQPSKPLIVQAKPKAIEDVKEIKTPPPISPIPPGGLEKNELHGEIPVPKAEINERISQTQEGEKTVNSIPPSNIAPRDGQGESLSPSIYITGPASKRKALYKPKFEAPDWLEKKGQSVQCNLKVWVLPDGSVDRVEIEESCGYAEIDRLAQTTVSRWRFDRLPPDVERIDWGIVSIAIRVK